MDLLSANFFAKYKDLAIAPENSENSATKLPVENSNPLHFRKLVSNILERVVTKINQDRRNLEGDDWRLKGDGWCRVTDYVLMAGSRW